MKTYFKEFNEEFFKGKGLPKVNWFDREGVYSIHVQNRLADERVVRITLEDLGTKNSFNGYMVEILSKSEGLIAKKFFRFEEHLTMIHKQLDSRYTKTNYYHAWLNDEKLDWYMSRPKDTKEMCERIFEWVNYFK